jgi:hypothetical protein
LEVYLCKGQEAVLSQPVLAAYSIKQDGEGGANQAAQGRQLPVLHVAAEIKIGSATILNSKSWSRFNHKYLAGQNHSFKISYLKLVDNEK